MSRALVNPTDNAHYASASLPAMSAFRVEMRMRNLVTSTGGNRYLFVKPNGGVNFNDALTFINFTSFKAGESGSISSAVIDEVFTSPALPRFSECYCRFQFDPVALRYSVEFWDLKGARYVGYSLTNGVAGAVVTNGVIPAGSWAVANNGSGGNRLGGDVDFFRIFKTNVPMGDPKPVDAAPLAADVYAAWEFEDSLADVTGTYPLTWNGGGTPTYGDTLEAPSIAPTLSSVVYSTGPDVDTLTFTAPNTGGQTATWVDVERRLGTTGDWQRVGFTTAAGATSYLDTLIKHAKTYNYRVKARNRLGSSPYSNVVAVTTGAGTDTNPTITENAKAGTALWLLTNPAAAQEIEGYCDQTSYQKGDTVNIKVSSAGAASFDLDVYRVGWYGGNGARLIRHVAGIAGTVQTVPTETNPSTGRYDFECQWTTSYALSLTDADTTEWPSGIYLGRLTQAGTGKQAYVIFCIRDESRQSELYYNQPVNTYQAYNYWPASAPGVGTGRSFYARVSAAVSFNRPYMIPAATASTHAIGSGSLLAIIGNADSRVNQASDEINWIRWLEKNGYDVQYGTDHDLHTLQEKIWARCAALLFPGHQEYTTLAERDTVIAARDYGRHLAFLGSNAFYWPARYEAGTTSGQALRTIVSYKDNASDPYALSPNPLELIRQRTNARWRELGNVPVHEETFIGVEFEGDFGNDPFVVTSAGAVDPIMAGTGLVSGESIAGLVGYEYDRNHGLNTFSPTILTDVVTATEAKHANSTIYRHPTGAVVYATGSMQFGWALDDFGAPAHRVSRLNTKVESLITNVMTLERTPSVAEAGTVTDPGPLTYAPYVL